MTGRSKKYRMEREPEYVFFRVKLPGLGFGWIR
jgi:hypothetical protein